MYTAAAAAESGAVVVAQSNANAQKPKAAAPAASAPQPAPAPPAPPAIPADTPRPALSAAAEPQPVIHATNAGVKACLDGIVRASNGTIDTQHTAMSQWFNGAADNHAFQSIVALAYPNKVAPHAAAILLGAPTATRACDTSTVEVFPTARPCNDVLGDLLKTGKVVADLSGLLVTQNAGGVRQILLPSAGNGCVIVAVGLTFGK